MDLPANVYTQSHLKKAGVRFSVNIVDTMCKKGFGLSYYAFVFLFISLVYCYSTDQLFMFASVRHFYVLIILVFLYILLYTYKVYKFFKIRKTLREDVNPIAVMAYAVVLLDIHPTNPDKIIRPKRCAIVYKECGALKPRFFTGAVKKIDYNFTKDKVTTVFIDRKHPAYYSVVEGRHYRIIGKKKKSGIKSAVEAFEMNGSNPARDNKL